MTLSAPPFAGYIPPHTITPAPPLEASNIILDDEPPNKKLRSEDNLIPEADFIAQHKVNFNFLNYVHYKHVLFLLYRVQ